MQALVPQIEIDEAEDAARRARFPAGSAIEFADLELDSRVRRARPPARRGADLVGAGARRLAGHLARARARAAEQARRIHRLGRAEPRARVARRDDAEHATEPSTRGSGGRSRSRSACVPCASASPSRSQRRVDALVGELAPRGGVRAGRGVRRARSRSASRATCSASRSTTSRACRSSTRRSPARWSTTATPSRSAAPTPRARSSTRSCWREVERSRERPDNSVTSAVANDPARGLSDDEIVAQLRVILFGAIETVESTIANAVLLLLEHPDAARRRARRPGFTGNAIEEGMRLIPPVAFIERWTAAPVALGGVDARGRRVPRRQHGRCQPRPGGVRRARALRRPPRQRTSPPHAQPRRATTASASTSGACSARRP